MLFFAFRNYGGCVWHWLDRNNGAVIALFTIIIGAFTGGILLVEVKGRRKELRAYVGVTRAHVAIEGRRLVAKVDYANKGSTPALDAELFLSAMIGDVAPIREPGVLSDVGKGGIILPGQEWRRHQPIREDYHEVRDVLTSGALRVWIWGTISYRDIFGAKCNVKFRFWSSNRLENEGTEFPTIPDIEGTKANYGED